MSHLQERKEKNCLNCNAIVYGKYCHICGQENIEPKESVWHLITHFFKDITHFDGKFFSTLKLLITRPGFLSREYMNGRRASYLNPIRMYVFTSAFFFLLFFSFYKIKDNAFELKDNSTVNGVTLKEIGAMDSATFAAFTSNVNKENKKAALPMTRNEFKTYLDSIVSRQGGISFSSGPYKNVAEYDSLLKAGKINDGWLMQMAERKRLSVNAKFNGDNKAMLKSFADILLHSLPQVMFVCLPLFALLLKIVYIRRKQFYYVNHAIFSIHFFIFTFLLFLLIFGLLKINNSLHLAIFNWLNVLLNIGIFIYLYKAMRNFYQQRRAKTILKFLLLSLSFVITLVFVFIVFIFLSLFKL